MRAYSDFLNSKYYDVSLASGENTIAPNEVRKIVVEAVIQREDIGKSFSVVFGATGTTGDATSGDTTSASFSIEIVPAHEAGGSERER